MAKFVGLGGSDRRTQKSVRALLTGYLLYTLAGDKTYKSFADPEVQLPRTDAADPELAPTTLEEKVVALQDTKRHLFDSVVGRASDIAAPLSADDIRGLLGD